MAINNKMKNTTLRQHFAFTQYTIVLLVSLCFYMHLSAAHVALTYPPARKYDLDFLDNVRTKGPCGMPKGSIRTSILSGSKFNVTWHLAYPHRGGFRLQLLDALDRPVLDLTPTVNGSEFVRNDVTAQAFQVNIPNDFECHNCTLRLLRQADEWSHGYRFWSCADVDVKNRKEFRETCSGKGKYYPSRCKCDKNHYGTQCQYRDECSSNQDCGIQGQCIDLQGTSLPRKQCYCNFGWYGVGCNKRSPYKTTELDLSAYTMKQLSPDYQLYWRLLEEQKEIEIVLKVNGTSWVGLGWRPRSLNKECKNFPLIRDIGDLVTSLNGTAEAEPKPSSEPESAAEPETNSEPEATNYSESRKAEPEASSEPEATKHNDHSTAEPEASSEPEATSEPVASKSKRVAVNDETPYMEGVTSVATSVSYRVSAKAGRRRRQATEPSIEPHPPSELETKSEPEPSSEPESKSEPEPASELDPKSEPQPTSEPQSISEPTTTSEPNSESEPEPTSEPHSKSEPEPKSEPNSASEPEPKSEPSSTSEPASKSEPSSASEPEPKSEPSSTSEPEPKSKPSSVSEPEPTSEPHSKSEPEPTSNSQPKKVVTSQNSEADQYKLNPYTPRHDFNPMDCTDIVIGSARGMASRVGDYYTRDRSTPRVDEFYGGKSDLSLGTGFELNGVTTIIFRKKLVAQEPTDHTLDDDLTHVIWAKGQEPGNYVHIPPSGIESQTAKIKDFYQPDELKYHGHKTQRGSTQINFFEKEKPETENAKDSNSPTGTTTTTTNVLDNDCYGHWKYPSSCTPDEHNCEYYVSWATVGRGDDMHWHIETTNTQTWTGIGFSNDEKMSQTDAIIGWVDGRNGRPFLMDTWINGYSSPKLDDRQDIYNATGRIEKGVTILGFNRKRISNDEQDLSFTDEHCLYLFFPVLGGAFNAVNKKIRKHEQVPPVSPTRVCIKSCGKELENLLNSATTPAPNRLVYAVGVKLMNLAESFEAPKPGTVEFNNLAATISDSFNGILNDIPGYYKTDILGFDKEGTTMVAKMQALFDKADYEKGQALETNTISDDKIVSKSGDVIKAALLDKVATGKVGSLTVDPQFLDFEALEYKAASNDDETKLSFFELSEMRLYTVLGLIAALVFIALIQAICTIYKTSRKNSAQKKTLIQNSPWKEFASNTNYAFDPYGETEEKNVTTTTTAMTNTGTKEKSRNRASNSSSSQQQTTLPMSHSPTSKSQMYNEGQSNGNGNGNQQARTRNSNNENGGTQEYRSNGRSQQRSSGGGASSGTGASSSGNAHYDRYERNAEQQNASMYASRSTYAERAYSLPRQQHQPQQHQQHQQQQPQQQQQHTNQPTGYYTHDRRTANRQAHDERRHYRDNSREDPRLSANGGADTPDFYFMPSQRKYSGEVVRVYVDYNKDPKH